jgi:hypothetical protein
VATSVVERKIAVIDAAIAWIDAIRAHGPEAAQPFRANFETALDDAVTADEVQAGVGDVMDVLAHGPTNEWAWPLPLYEHGGGRELSSKQWDAYKEPVIEVVPAEQLRGAVDPETLERHRWALDAAVRFITENGGNPDVVKSLLVLAEWGQ